MLARADLRQPQSAGQPTQADEFVGFGDRQNSPFILVSVFHTHTPRVEKSKMTRGEGGGGGVRRRLASHCLCMHLSGHWPSKRLKRKLVRRRGSRRQLKLVEEVGCEKQNKRNFLKQNVGDKIVAPTDTDGA